MPKTYKITLTAYLPYIFEEVVEVPEDASEEHLEEYAQFLQETVPFEDFFEEQVEPQYETPQISLVENVSRDASLKLVDGRLVEDIDPEPSTAE